MGLWCGFDPKKHMMDPFFFLTLVFPMEDINKGGLQLRGFWDKICEWSNTYAVSELKLGGDKGHKFELRKSHHFIRWFGVVLMNGVVDWLLPFDGGGMLSTVQRGRMPQFKADEVHKSKKGVTKATKAARNTNAITVVDVPGDGTPPKRAHISLKCTSTVLARFLSIRKMRSGNGES